MPAALVARPRLAAAAGLGVIVGVLLSLIPNALAPSTRLILSWDAGCCVFLASVLTWMRGCVVEEMRALAASQDEGAGAILGLSLLAAMASLAAIVVELTLAKGDHGLVKNLRLLLAFVTVVLSWAFVQMIFAIHYAHEYYAPQDDNPAETRGGLGFPGGERPDYWDFLHFSLVIGVAAQTADISFTSKALRRVGTIHSVVAFSFNTVVLAMSINVAASLF